MLPPFFSSSRVATMWLRRRTAVDDIGTVFCHFDNGRSLGLAYGEDSFRKLTPEELAEEQVETHNESMDEDEGPAMQM